MRLLRCIVLVFFWTFLSTSASAEEALRFGAAKVNFDIPEGTPLAGYGKRHAKPSSGVHDPVSVRAAALTQGGRTFVIVSADLVLIDAELREDILKEIKKFTALPPENLLLTATHTHSGPGAYGNRFWEKFVMGKQDEKFYRSMVAAFSKSIRLALEHQSDTSVQFGSVRIDDLIQSRLDDTKRDPHHLKIIRFQNAGKIHGHWIFMAAHPTLLPAFIDEMSADFPGVLAQSLEGKGGTALFINGAAGDLRPRAGEFENRFEKVKDYGMKLAARAEKIEFHPLSLEGPWLTVLEKRKLPKVQARAGFLKFPSLISGRFFPRHSYFQTLRMGPLLIFGFPGELASDLGRSLESQARAYSLEPLLAGYANDYIGYVVPESYYQNRDHYEARASFYGGNMDRFTETVLRAQMLKLLTLEEKQQHQEAGRLIYKEGLPVLYLKGDAYHLGYEEGRLLKKEIQNGIDSIDRYFRSELKVPLLNRLIIAWLAGRAWKQQEPHISYEDMLHMEGLAAGSGVPLKKIQRLHAMPEIFPALCTNGAYWGKATQDGKLIAIRNLDWNRKMGVQDWAAVKWIETPGKLSYANIGYYGFSGVLSGINEEGISVGQIGAVSSDETMKGTPMPFLLKRVLETASTAEEALPVFQNHFRTRGYHYLISDPKQSKAVLLETTAKHMAVFWEGDAREKEAAYSLPIENALFRGDPALDPKIRDLQTASGGEPKKEGLETPTGSAYEIRYLKHGKLVQDAYGKLTSETAKQIAKEIAPGSNIQSVIYHYPEFEVANAKGDLKAAESGYVLFSLEELKNLSADVA